MAIADAIDVTVDQLRRRIAGSVLTPSDAGFDDARTPLNLAARHRPAVVVVAATAADVAAAVAVAADQGLRVTVQATGHGVTRPAAGSMLIVVSRLVAADVDADAWTARVTAGTSCGAVTALSQQVGLAPLLGRCPTSSAVGSVLRGGWGWLTRRYGPALDHVRAVEIVTADGRLRRLGADDEPDLFRALQGGAGGFGVVTAMEVDLAPVEQVYAGELHYPGDRLAALGARYRTWAGLVPDEMTSALILVGGASGPGVILRGCHLGPKRSGEPLLRFWRDWETPAHDRWRPATFGEFAASGAHPGTPAWRLATTDWLDDLGSDVFDLLARLVAPDDGSPPLDRAEIRHVGRAAGPALSPTTGSSQPERFLLELTGTARTRAELTRLRNRVGEVRHLLGGTGQLSSSRPEPGARERLEAIARRFDPEGVFRSGPPPAREEPPTTRNAVRRPDPAGRGR